MLENNLGTSKKRASKGLKEEMGLFMGKRGETVPSVRGSMREGVKLREGKGRSLGSTWEERSRK